MRNLIAKIEPFWKFVIALVGAITVTVIPVLESSVDDGHIDQGEAVTIVATAIVAFGTAAGVYKKKNAPLPGALTYDEHQAFAQIRAHYDETYTGHQE